MSWGIFAYVETTGKDGNWHLVLDKPIVQEMKYLIDWDEDYDSELRYSDLSEEFQRKLHDDAVRTHEEQLEYYRKQGGVPEGYEEFDEAAFKKNMERGLFRELTYATLSKKVSEIVTKQSASVSAMYRALGCRYADDLDEIDFYEEKFDEDGHVSKDWNPMTYPVNKDLLYDVLVCGDDAKKANKLSMLLEIMDGLRQMWNVKTPGSKITSVIEGDVRLVLEYC